MKLALSSCYFIEDFFLPPVILFIYLFLPNAHHHWCANDRVQSIKSNFDIVSESSSLT